MIAQNKSPVRFGLRPVMELFDVGPAAAISALASAVAIVMLAILYFVHSAPPTTITISTGPEGSVFQKNALKYQKILEKNGVKLNVLTSEGSLQNIDRLTDPKSHVDIAMVQGGITNAKAENLVSLGSISYLPLLIFYRGKRQELLSGFNGKKITAARWEAEPVISPCPYLRPMESRKAGQRLCWTGKSVTLQRHYWIRRSTRLLS